MGLHSGEDRVQIHGDPNPSPTLPPLYLFFERSFHTRPDLGFPFGITGSSSFFNFLGAGAWGEDITRFFMSRPPGTVSPAGGGLVGSCCRSGVLGAWDVSSCGG